jgi:hypothetical protein
VSCGSRAWRAAQCWPVGPRHRQRQATPRWHQTAAVSPTLPIEATMCVFDGVCVCVGVCVVGICHHCRVSVAEYLVPLRARHPPPGREPCTEVPKVTTSGFRRPMPRGSSHTVMPVRSPSLALAGKKKGENKDRYNHRPLECTPLTPGGEGRHLMCKVGPAHANHLPARERGTHSGHTLRPPPRSHIAAAYAVHVAWVV